MNSRVTLCRTDLSRSDSMRCWSSSSCSAECLWTSPDQSCSLRVQPLCKLIDGGFALLDIFRFELLLHEPNVVLDEVSICIECCNDALLQDGFLCQRSAFPEHFDAAVVLLGNSQNNHGITSGRYMLQCLIGKYVVQDDVVDARHVNMRSSPYFVLVSCMHHESHRRLDLSVFLDRFKKCRTSQSGLRSSPWLDEMGPASSWRMTMEARTSARSFPLSFCSCHNGWPRVSMLTFRNARGCTGCTCPCLKCCVCCPIARIIGPSMWWNDLS